MNSGILVTGCAGFIGTHLTMKLLEEGIPVYGIDNFDPFYSKELKLKNLKDIQECSLKNKTKFEFLELDIINLSSEVFSENKIDGVIHLAAKAGVRPSLENSKSYLEVNVIGTNQVLEFARIRGIRDFIFGSSSSVYGNDSTKPFQETARAAMPLSPYAASKRSAELACYSYHHLYQLNFAVLRFFTVYGPRQRPDLAIRKFSDAIREGRQITLFGTGESSRDYTFVTDIVDGILRAKGWLTKQNKSQFEIFNLGGSKTTTLIDLVRGLEEAIGKKASIIWKDAQPGDVDHTLADVSKSFEILGYEPKTTIDQGLKFFAQWMKETEQT